MIAIYSLENELPQKYSYKKPYNDLYLYTELREDSDFVTKLGSNQKLAGLETAEFDSKIPYYSLEGLSDSLFFGGITSFYRNNKTSLNKRYQIYELLSIPNLNIFSSFCSIQIRDEDTPPSDKHNIISLLNDAKELKSHSQHIRRDRFSDMDPIELLQQSKETKKSISEVYNLQSSLLSFDSLPKINAKIVKRAGFTSLKLKNKDIWVANTPFQRTDRFIDVQTAMINHPRELFWKISTVLEKTNLKSIASLKIKLEVNADMLHDMYDNLDSLKDLYEEVQHEN